MTTCQSPAPQVSNTSAEALHDLKELLQNDAAFAKAMSVTESTEDAARLAAKHGVHVTQEALWRNRGTLESGGMPTWRG